MNLDTLKARAVDLLRQACHPYGIAASPDEQENYRRLWSRDAMISGIAGLLAGDDTVINGFRRSIETLARHRHPSGFIPSNLLPRKPHADISFGSLAGRVDATGWFVAGSCLYLLNRAEESLKTELKPILRKSLELYDLWEYNGRGLVYTPLSGNWADEYPISGHTLYDNLLRVWAMELYGRLYDDAGYLQKARKIRGKVRINFWPDSAFEVNPGIYHPRAFRELANRGPNHFAAAVGPDGYHRRFDAAGHGLAFMLGIVKKRQVESILEYQQEIYRSIGKPLLPAFWPVIMEGDARWHLLVRNYSYSFKNRPHHFHNGGIWPVWMGWYGLGLSTLGQPETAETFLESWMDIEGPETLNFCEYISSDQLIPAGKPRLCFSAAGLILLISAIKKEFSPLITGKD